MLKSIQPIPKEPVEMTLFTRQDVIAPPILPHVSTPSKTMHGKNVSHLQIKDPIQHTHFIENQIKNFVISIPNDLLDGWHEFQTPEGDYSGPIANGKLMGEGTITVPYGTYEGELYNLPHGKGVLTTPIGRVKGTFVNGTCHGIADASFVAFQELSKKIKKGCIDTASIGTISLKERYQGEYREGKCEGTGGYWYADGTYYSGTFKNGKREGQGLCLFPNDDSYEGEWQGDRMTGRGRYTEANGESYEGEWVNNLRHGKGVLISRSSRSDVTYNEGELVTE